MCDVIPSVEDTRKQGVLDAWPDEPYFPPTGSVRESLTNKRRTEITFAWAEFRASFRGLRIAARWAWSAVKTTLRMWRTGK